MRRAARADHNQQRIMDELRALGLSVRDTSKLGQGFADIAVGGIGTSGKKFNWLFEIKDGAKPPSQRKLTPHEQKFKDEWRGQYDVITCANDALSIIGIGTHKNFKDGKQR